MHHLLRLTLTIAACGLLALPIEAAAAPSATPAAPSATPAAPSPTPAAPSPASPSAAAPSADAGLSLQETTDVEARMASRAADSAPWPGNPFSSKSFWNSALSAHAPVRANSRAYVAELLRQVHDYHPWFNTTSYSVPVYVVGPRQRTQQVKLDTWGPDLQHAFDAVPIPRSARSAVGTDQSLSIWQPSTNRLWDFWLMRRVKGRWHARWGGEMDSVSSNPGYFTHAGATDNWGATATGLPLLGGLVTFADLQRGYINHALAMALVETQRADWTWPAQRTDGNVFSQGIQTPIPEGMRFRLDPRLDIAKLNLPPIDAMLARAAQKYGIVVRDKAGAVVLYGQDPVGKANPWPAAFDNQYPNNVLALFPWGHLQALKSTTSCCWAP
jgi:hypothetical protein